MIDSVRLRIGMMTLCLSALAVPAATVSAQAALPSPEDVLGYGIGEEFTDVASLYGYFRALAAASDEVSIDTYGESNEGRALIQVLIATAEHRARLDEILALNRELTDPETSEARAQEIISENPTVIYFTYGIHGNESSSSEASMWTAWDIARRASDVATVLDNAIVIIDPSANPDGRDRYVSFYKRAKGAEPNANPSAREHSEPWPGGRTNHYYFDLNRDWSWGSQKETRDRAATWPRWNPQVHVDFHEMGYTSTYFFFPATPPINPLYPNHTLEWGERFGDANAEAFDRNGWLYYTTEGFDLFYPGYGDSWPSLMGAIGMTYEQAGSGAGGLVIERPDGTMLTLTDRAQHHRVAGNTTARTAADGKDDLLSGFAEFHRTIDEGLSDVVLVPGDDPEGADALVRLLLWQGVEVERAGREFQSADATAHVGFEERQTFPAGSYLIRARQPRGRLAMTLLNSEIVLDASFSYDISAWSLAYAYGVEAHTLGRAADGNWSSVGESDVMGRTSADGSNSGSGRFGYLLEPGFDAAPALVDFLEAGGRAFVMGDTFTAAGRNYPYGTTFFPRGRNDDLDSLIDGAGLRSHLIPVESGLTEGGPDLGTNASAELSLPRIALLGGQGTSSGSFGMHWFFMEQRLGIPFDNVNVASFGGLDLEEYDVIVAPSGNVSGTIGENGRERLAEWVRDGGTLIAVGGTARALGNALANVEVRSDNGDDDEEEDELAIALRTLQEREEDRWADQIPGTILKANLDPRHPLAFGAGIDGDDTALYVLSQGTTFEPEARFQSVAYFPDELGKISGVISENNLDRLSQSSWLVNVGMGGGNLVLFSDEPFFRMFWYSGFQLYTNALLFAPAF